MVAETQKCDTYLDDQLYTYVRVCVLNLLHS